MENRGWLTRVQAAVSTALAQGFAGLCLLRALYRR
jgi:hypothetical protein